jgi:hypothetical protein
MVEGAELLAKPHRVQDLVGSVERLVSAPGRRS